MLSQAHTTMLLTHGAPIGAWFASCRPVDELAQRMRTNDAVNAA